MEPVRPPVKLLDAHKSRHTEEPAGLPAHPRSLRSDPKGVPLAESKRDDSPISPAPSALNRRDFLRQTVGFSALAAMAPSAFAQNPTPTADAVSPDPANAHMLMIGDWGTNKYLGQQIAVAGAMKNFVDKRQIHPQSLFLLGDNWYGTMLDGVKSSRWQTQFEQMYPTSHFPGKCYAVLGNHDYEYKVTSKAEMQLAYAAANPGTRWTMPSKWYTFNWPEQNPVIKFICLDTNLPGSKGDFFKFTITMHKEERDAEYAWLKAELAKPRTTPFVACVAHHPVYTNGVHKDNPILIKDIEPLLRQYKVDFWISGHDHDLQHLEFANHPTSFVVSGGGGAELVDWTVDPSTRGPYGGKMLGFSDLEATRDAIILRHFDQNGKEVHAFRKYPGGKMEIMKTS